MWDQLLQIFLIIITKIMVVLAESELQRFQCRILYLGRWDIKMREGGQGHKGEKERTDRRISPAGSHADAIKRQSNWRQASFPQTGQSPIDGTIFSQMNQSLTHHVTAVHRLRGLQPLLSHSVTCDTTRPCMSRSVSCSSSFYVHTSSLSWYKIVITTDLPFLPSHLLSNTLTNPTLPFGIRS